FSSLAKQSGSDVSGEFLLPPVTAQPAPRPAEASHRLTSTEILVRWKGLSLLQLVLGQLATLRGISRLAQPTAGLKLRYGDERALEPGLGFCGFSGAFGRNTPAATKHRRQGTNTPLQGQGCR